MQCVNQRLKLCPVSHRRVSTAMVFAALALRAAVASAAPEVPKPPTTAGKIEAVTVYRGQALVTRVVDAAGPAGVREIVITDLPERIVPESLFAEADAGVEVRGLRFRTRPVSQDVRDDVRQFEAKLQEATDAQSANAKRRETIAQQRSYLDRLEQFSGPTANAELKNGVLNAETLKALTLFVFEQRKTEADEELTLDRQAREIGQTIGLLQRELSELTRGATKSVREAVLLADFKANAGPLRVKYLVDAASWSPSYVARCETAGDGKRAVTMQYNAAVQQQSGEDWTDVAMTLSTATPSLVAAAPALDPLTIRLTRAPAEEVAAAATLEKFKAERDQLYFRRSQAESTRNSSININSANAVNGPMGGGGFASGGAIASNAQAQPQAAMALKLGSEPSAQQDAELNGIAGKLQVLELVAKDAGRSAGGRADASASQQEGVSVTYALPGRTSLPSRQDQQNVRIATLDAQGEFYKLAMPVLTTYVYDQASVVNPGPSVLLAGPVASYLGGQYVGAGTLPTVAAGEKFTVGFGIDASLRASRELVEKSETTQAGNRVMTFTYRLLVENFGKTPAVVRLTDRLPVSPDGDVKVSLISTTKEPTTRPSADVVATGPAAKRTGMIVWSADAAPETVADKAASVQYQYKLEFDKQLTIAK